MPGWLRILFGVIIMGVGFLLVKQTEWFFKWTGRILWAERKFGWGGTRFFIKLVGVGVVFIGVFVATNIISDVLTSFAKIFVRE